MRRHSILGEIGWLMLFIALLVIFVYGVNILVDTIFPRHFNDKVADAIAALFAAVVFMTIRSRAAGRGG